MLLLNVLSLAVVITTVSCRSIGDVIPTLRLPSTLSPTTPHTEPQCLFQPHQPPQSTSPESTIPSHAWSHIATLLKAHTPLTSPQSRVQTLRISELVGDSSLEGVVLGLVFTVSEPVAAEKELRSLNENEQAWGREMGREERDKMCLEAAVSQVEAERMMEGVLQVQSRWRVGFLVYMVD
ncbi:hypothetical protein L207DRAFT_579122 [Hyaloscypha variabilis F]|uniref:Uncharacterized protein n=1 Tax=Hyaloscypha variabilis (strain UAMH 11265 / GT02V1 / F) TaxID=1149755 RepID=A0A2J6S077_HYAVF|nr:hypothetical protein L207DRAFT_579122 [Hyaloscypha variabilis F]